MTPGRRHTSDNPTLSGSARVCVQGLPVPLRALGLAASTLLFSALLALAPFDIHACISANDSTNSFSGVYVERCEAHALTIEPGSTALDFVNQMAMAAGMSAGELVTTTLGIAAVGSGAILATQQGQNWGMTAGEALSNVVEAADYPDYDSLTTEQKNLWGTKENYDAAKYVSLMNGLGFGTEYERFEQLQGSGGGNFEFEDDVQDRLNQFYRIGSLWQSRLGVLFGDIAALIDNVDLIKQFPVGTVSDAYLFDATEIEDWPSGLPKQVYIAETNLIIRTSGSSAKYTGVSTVVNALVFVTNNSPYISVSYFDRDSAFVYSAIWYNNPNVSYSVNSSANTLSYKGENITFNYGNIATTITGDATYNVPVNVTSSNVTNDQVKKAIAIILASGQENTSESSSIVDYPDGDVSNNQRIYYPENGVTPDTTWNNFTTPQVPQRENETPFNPGNQTQTPQWQTDTEENVLPIMDLPFDKLFPFCLLYDVPLLLEKILGATSGGVSAQDANRYNVIKFEIPEMSGIGFAGFEFELDLQPLEDLLDLIRPILQMFLIVVLLAASIEFFKQIITG